MTLKKSSMSAWGSSMKSREKLESGISPGTTLNDFTEKIGTLPFLPFSTDSNHHWDEKRKDSVEYGSDR